MTRSATLFPSRKTCAGAVTRVLLAVSFCISTIAFAEPVVTGNTISWPDNGWYQVQDANTYSEVCSGGRLCEVADGTYIVINHSNRTRWDSVIVGAESSASGDLPTTVTVSGSTIRWPDDGWYQVQSASTYETLCQGGLSCQAGAGRYIVINHTTGERFDNVVVGSETDQDNSASAQTEPSGNPDFDSRVQSWSIDGSTLRFHTDDWYQVQDASYPFEFETVCQGESSCVLDNGIYQIVNHSSGEIWQRVTIGSPNVWWTQTHLFRALVRWNVMEYNFAPLYSTFNVYLNGQLFETVTNRREIIVEGFSRGTNYRLAVYGVDVDGSEALVGERDILTDGPAASVVPYGRPAGDNNTFGFEMWDLIPDQQLSDFPSDCLFAIPAGSFCFSPATRYLIGYSTSPNSTQETAIDWEFILPGDNDTNHIEALVHFFGTGGRRSPAKQMALVADVTTQFGQASYEISVFRGPGSFLGTYPILESVQFSSGNGTERQINLDGADLHVTIGPVRPYEDPAPWWNSQPRRLHIAGEYYEPNSTGDVSDLSGWNRIGAFMAVVDAQSGENLSLTFHPAPACACKKFPSPDDLNKPVARAGPGRETCSD